MRVTVIGNCQSAGLASCLSTMVAGLQVTARGPATPIELLGPVSYTHLTLPTNREV
mgnify:CR=1 FL=1